MTSGEKGNFFINILFRFHKLIIAFVSIVSFFLFYNFFLIDYTLENLEFSLAQTALAYDIQDLGGLDMVLTRTLAQESPPYGVNSANNANLEYAKSIVTTGKNFKQIDYMKIALSSVIKDRQKGRGLFLTLVDKINRPIRSLIIQIAYFPRYLFKIKESRPASQQFDVELIEKIRSLEKEKDLKKVISDYKDFIERYPGYEKLSLIKLQLGYAYQRLGKYDLATDVYKDVVKRYFPNKEAMIAQILLVDLNKKNILLKKANQLLIQSRSIPKDDMQAKQKILYDLGVIYTQVLDMEDAIKFFDKAAKADPSSDMAIKAQFNMAWLHKQKNDFDKSIESFQKVIGKNVSKDLYKDVRYQLADIYRSQGKYEESIQLFMELAKDYEDNPAIASLCIFQVGASYMYDLNDPERAAAIFADLVKKYPNSSYGKYTSPDSPIGIFVTYLVPRATRVVAWRMMGLLCLAGYTGDIMKFSTSTKEDLFNVAFNNWLKVEVPDTVGNLYVDIRGSETRFKDGYATSKAKITMGQFSVDGNSSWTLNISPEKMLNFVTKKVVLQKIPIPPFLINNSLVGMRRIIEKNLPLEINKIVMKNGEILVEGYGTGAMLARLTTDTDKLFMTKFKVEPITDPEEKEEVLREFMAKFPEADFSSEVKKDDESLFLDFFTRISLYISFKILETVKDSKLDYERSVRSLGALMVKRENFRVEFNEDYVNGELARYLQYEFPWLIEKRFLIDVKGLELNFKKDGDVKFKLNLGLNYSNFLTLPDPIKVDGTMIFKIDEKSGLPQWVFKNISLNGIPFPVDKLNLVTLRCLNILKDERLPLAMEEVTVSEDKIIFKGKGAGDFTGRIFYDPHPFVIFQIRSYDLAMAGIQRVKYVAGRGILNLDSTSLDKEGAKGAGTQADIEGAYYQGKTQYIGRHGDGDSDRYIRSEEQYRH